MGRTDIIVESTPVESEGKRTTRYVTRIRSGGVPRSTIRATTRGVGADLPTGLPAERTDSVDATRAKGYTTERPTRPDQRSDAP